MLTSRVEEGDTEETGGGELSRHDRLSNKEANLQYVADSLDYVKGNLGEFINHHVRYQRPRLVELEDYYRGHNTAILSRRGRTNKNNADNRVASPYASYISEFIQGYLTSIPVKTTTKDEKMRELIDKVSAEQEIDFINSEILLDMSKFGRAYELVYYRGGDSYKAVQLPVLNTFMIYDNTISQEELCAVYYRLESDYTTGTEYKSGTAVEVTIYTKEEAITLKKTKLTNFEYVEDEVDTHGMDEVPVIAYQQDRTRMGDYEKVITLIDAYDAQASDLANYMSDLNDAMLVISGDLSGLDWVQVARDLSDGILLGLQSGETVDGKEKPITAEYLSKSYDVSGSDSSFKRLRDDIHKFTRVPDLTDSNFSGNSSGIAMRYKLLGLEQLAGKKIRTLERGFNKRYRLFVDLNETVSDITGIKDESVSYKWTVNIPENVADELKSFVDAGGELSQASLLTTLSFISSVEEEKQRIVAEKLGMTYEEVEKLTDEEVRGLLSVSESGEVG